ncbi:hypothetical protein ScPMuIL_014561 [Solemya velum]
MAGDYSGLDLHDPDSKFNSSTRIYQKCSDDLGGCRKKRCKSVRGKKHHHWVCLALCWVDFQICMSQLKADSIKVYW